MRYSGGKETARTKPVHEHGAGAVSDSDSEEHCKFETGCRKDDKVFTTFLNAGSRQAWIAGEDPVREYLKDSRAAVHFAGNSKLDRFHQDTEGDGEQWESRCRNVPARLGLQTF